MTMFPIPSIPLQMVFNLTARLSLPHEEHEDGLQPDNISQFQASIAVIINTLLNSNEKTDIQRDIILVPPSHYDRAPFYALPLKCKFGHRFQTEGGFVAITDPLQLLDTPAGPDGDKIQDP